MSGGPQVFLGATTFCSRCHQISGCRLISGRRVACPPARLGNRASLGASSRSPDRSQSVAHGHRIRLPQASQRPPSDRPGCSAISHVIPLRVFQTLKSLRWNCNVLRGGRKLTDVNYVRLLLGVASWPRRTDNETPLADAVRGLWPTQVRPPSASTAPRPRTRRSTPRRRWGGSSRAGWLGGGST